MVLFLGQLAIGQSWQLGTNLLYTNSATTKVGIGITNSSEVTSPLTVKGDIEIYGGATTALTSKLDFNLNIRAGITSTSTGRILNLKGGPVSGSNNIPGSIVMISGNQSLSVPPYNVESTAPLEVGWNTIRIGTGSSLAILRNGGYLLGVSGKMIAEEVVVKLASSWSDFVFAKNYQLRPLSELESFIKTHQHLPGIPSECELKEKDGIAVSDMLNRQMQKIEELHLYLIEQDKLIKTLRQELETIKAKGGVK